MEESTPYCILLWCAVWRQREQRRCFVALEADMVSLFELLFCLRDISCAPAFMYRRAFGRCIKTDCWYRCRDGALYENVFCCIFATIHWVDCFPLKNCRFDSCISYLLLCTPTETQFSNLLKRVPSNPSLRGGGYFFSSKQQYG